MDLEAIAEETQRERLELLEFLKEQAGQERAAERAERADRVGATVAAYAEGGGDVDEATDDVREGRDARVYQCRIVRA